MKTFFPEMIAVASASFYAQLKRDRGEAGVGRPPPSAPSAAPSVTIVVPAAISAPLPWIAPRPLVG